MPEPQPPPPAQQLVTARRAAELTGLNERTIRRMIHRGDLSAVKVAVNRYLINVADLPPRRRNKTQEQLDALRSDLDALKRRVSALENAKTPPDALRLKSDGVAPLDLSSIVPLPPKPPSATYSATFPPSPMGRAPETQDDHFDRISAAATFLERHGVNVHTVLGWSWLKDALAIGPISATDLLIRTQEHIRGVKWRRGGSVLYKCLQSNCACQSIL